MTDICPNRCKICDHRACECILNGKHPDWQSDPEEIQMAIAEAMGELSQKEKNDQA